MFIWLFPVSNISHLCTYWNRTPWTKRRYCCVQGRMYVGLLCFSNFILRVARDTKTQVFIGFWNRIVSRGYTSFFVSKNSVFKIYFKLLSVSKFRRYVASLILLDRIYYVPYTINMLWVINCFQHLCIWALLTVSTKIILQKKLLINLL